MAFELEVDELERLREENDGLLTVAAVVEAAKNDTSPLHKHFDWDDTHAAEKYREWQARTLIQKCKITVEHKPDTMIRAYVSVPSDRKEGGYRAVQDVLDDIELRESLMKEMRARISYWQKQCYLLDAETQRALKHLETALMAKEQQELRAG
jgi:hypothetical protein